jgi:hypothetical protein
LLGSFALTTQFKVNNNFIDYLDAHKIRTWDKVRDIFILPFRIDYLLTFIIAFSLIWNESLVNNILSDIIPSFVTELNKAITGRAANYATGMSYLLVSISLALISVFLWNLIVTKNQNKLKQIEINNLS